MYLGRALLHGNVLPADLGRAETLLQEAAAAGNSAAQSDLGSAYLSGSPLPRDAEAGLRWLEAAIDQGNRLAMHELGYAYWKGDGVPQDRAKAEELLGRAASSVIPRPSASWKAAPDGRRRYTGVPPLQGGPTIRLTLPQPAEGTPGTMAAGRNTPRPNGSGMSASTASFEARLAAEAAQRQEKPAPTYGDAVAALTYRLTRLTQEVSETRQRGEQLKPALEKGARRIQQLLGERERLTSLLAERDAELERLDRDWARSPSARRRGSGLRLASGHCPRLVREDPVYPQGSGARQTEPLRRR